MRLILTRLAQMLFVLWVVATLLFYMFRMMPGDPLRPQRVHWHLAAVLRPPIGQHLVWSR